jgi:primosomal protein N' (replication factor Y)
LQLSTAQQIAFEELKQVLFKRCFFIAWRYFERKTEIYIKLIQEYLQTGKQILYLLPSTFDDTLVGRLRTYFGNKVAVFHSKYSNNERVEVWNQV